MEITISKDNNILVTNLSGKLNSTTVTKLEESLRQHTSPPLSHLVLNCQDLEYISSAGLRIVLSLTKTFAKTDWHFTICCLQEHVLEVFEMSGFDSLVTIKTSQEEAKEKLS
ncbi:STAS domain-containing protein [Desulfotalea psychrophila]|uniref:Anti-sigma factor antagonist n=1 Tax=Desulfotalea psychrophila (strain LSv54 / DSM 12343) TaxID=177439 RepID=Q6AM03_DESPS|nr:STAS domain-containing protein [Desulfotalea psychrophila]CAG36622.1 related to sigma regulatory factor [Desulfotalea psychrophila LSv54]